MANQSEIRNNDKKNLSGLITVKRLGGTIDDAIAQAKASMDKQDVLDVLAEFEGANPKQI
ncbi:MAG: hypothetical protein FWH07_05630 [Oscillospiraceae bacterium]|nr:hypothetical protein [Oscillospiraceae bacterium]